MYIYILLHGLRCRKSTIMDYSINQAISSSWSDQLYSTP